MVVWPVYENSRVTLSFEIDFAWLKGNLFQDIQHATNCSLLQVDIIIDYELTMIKWLVLYSSPTRASYVKMSCWK